MNIRAFLLFLLITVVPGMAQTLDQTYNPGSSNTVNYGVDDTFTRAQTFTVGITGMLVGIEIYTQAISPDTLFWDLRPTTGGVPTATRASALASGSLPSSSLPGAASFHYFDLSAFNLNVTNGNQLAFTMWGATGDTVGAFFGRTDNGYAGGAAYTGATGLTTTWTELTGTDFRFQTYVTAVPEPSSYALAMGLGALALLRWRRHRA